MKNYTRVYIFSVYSLIIFLVSFGYAFARGGGGGSSSGGGSGGEGGGILKLIVLIITIIYAWYVRKERIKKAKLLLEQAVATDPSWKEHGLKQRVAEVFLSFQDNWSNFNTEKMKSYLTESFYNKTLLQLQVLKNQHRKNIMQGVVIKSINMWDVIDGEGKDGDKFTVEIKAQADDTLIDTNTNKVLYKEQNSLNNIGEFSIKTFFTTDHKYLKSSFTEFWEFVRQDGVWKLNLIKQITEDKNMVESNVQMFARANGFFYDPDFGWLMMPNKGVIFRNSNFKTSDINNHVIGVHKGKIVEFYTFIPFVSSRGRYGATGVNYIVAQTMLPVSYNNILVRRRRSFWNFAPRGLSTIKTESNDFNRKFCLYAHKNDHINSFVLLAPDFMEEVYNLPFELNIEIVENFLYLYVKNRKDVSENEMLRILSKAFDSMRIG